MKADFQIGKNGITENFLETLKIYFTKNRNARISILKGANRDEKKEYVEKILDSLGKNYTSKTIGFVIVIKKWRKNKRD